jgi:Ala-tRNA(Pro) deacylase
MSVSPVLADYLSQHHVNYEILKHAQTCSSMATAREAHVPADKLAKAVVVRQEDRYVMCVIPASNQLVVEWLEYGRQHGYEIADESELQQLFPDCDRGAIPCLGDAFHMDVIVDSSLLESDMDVYIEGGDHSHLLHLSHKDFSRLMANAWSAPISCLRGGQGDKPFLWAPPEDG